MTKGWSEERRKKQAERCRQNKPWEQSTGPKTTEGKKRSSLNAYKHGHRCGVWDECREMLRLNREFVSRALNTARGIYDMERLEAALADERTERKRAGIKQNQRHKAPHPLPIYERTEGSGQSDYLSGI